MYTEICFGEVAQLNKELELIISGNSKIEDTEIVELLNKGLELMNHEEVQDDFELLYILKQNIQKAVISLDFRHEKHLKLYPVMSSYKNNLVVSNNMLVQVAMSVQNLTYLRNDHTANQHDDNYICNVFDCLKKLDKLIHSYKQLDDCEISNILTTSLELLSSNAVQNDLESLARLTNSINLALININGTSTVNNQYSRWYVEHAISN